MMKAKFSRFATLGVVAAMMITMGAVAADNTQAGNEVVVMESARESGIVPYDYSTKTFNVALSSSSKEKEFTSGTSSSSNNGLKVRLDDDGSSDDRTVTFILREYENGTAIRQASFALAQGESMKLRFDNTEKKWRLFAKYTDPLDNGTIKASVSIGEINSMPYTLGEQFLR